MENFSVIFRIILTEIISVIVSFGMGFLFNYLKRFLEENRITKTLKLVCNNEDNIYCYTATPPSVNESLNGKLGYVYEYMALCTLQSSIPKTNLNVLMPGLNYDDIPPNNLSNNLILIGGPLHNSVTNQLIFNSNFPFRFDSNNNLIYTQGTRTLSFKPKFSKDGKCIVDIALIVVTNNPNNLNKKIVALIGCHSLGCYGAACYIKYGINKEKKIKDDNYAIVVSCKNCSNNGSIFNENFSKEIFDKNIEYIKL